MAVVEHLLGHAGALAHHFASVDPRLIALALVFHVANHGLRSLAWRNVLAAAYPDKRVTFPGVTAAYATGVAMNALVPARGGDAAKVALVRAQIPESSFLTVGATMPVLLIFDTVATALLLLAVGITGGVPLHSELPSATGLIAEHPFVTTMVVLTLAIGLSRLVRRGRARLSSLWIRVRQGGAVLGSPVRYLTRVALVQAISWLCRLAVVMSLLAAFGLPASPLVAGVVMVVAGVSTAMPLTPGGAGTQQVLLAYALTGVASAGAVVSFSVAMQVGVTIVNAVFGVGGAMFACRTLKPLAAVRSGLALARAGG
jgi:uncharacterized membrane protein YbhN (UPF0104 family)